MKNALEDLMAADRSIESVVKALRKGAKGYSELVTSTGLKGGEIDAALTRLRAINAVTEVPIEAAPVTGDQVRYRLTDQASNSRMK